MIRLGLEWSVWVEWPEKFWIWPGGWFENCAGRELEKFWWKEFWWNYLALIKHSFVVCPNLLQNKHRLSENGLSLQTGGDGIGLFVEEYWFFSCDSWISRLMRETAMTISTGLLARTIWASVLSNHVKRLFSAIESTISIWACFSLPVRFCLLIAAITLAWCVRTLAQNVNGYSLESSSILCKSWMGLDKFRGSPK